MKSDEPTSSTIKRKGFGSDGKILLPYGWNRNRNPGLAKLLLLAEEAHLALPLHDGILLLNPLAAALSPYRRLVVIVRTPRHETWQDANLTHGSNV